MKKGLRCALFCAMLSPESSDMRTPHTWLLTVLALGFAWCTFPAYAQQPATWLSPESTEDNPFLVTNGTLGAEWSVLNAPDQETQDTELSGYTLTPDGTLGSYLDFFAANPLGSQESVYLALGISQNANDTEQRPIEMDSTMGADGFRTDNIFVKARFERSATAPSMEDLQEMYATYQERLDTDPATAQVFAVAPKVGIYVDVDGKFCLSRVRAETTGTAENLVTEWCKTNVSYDDVGGGAVIVRIEFRTFALQGAPIRERAFRVYVRNATQDVQGAEDWKCLTTGLGYQWSSSQTDGYKFDFSSQGDWFYALDSAAAVLGDPFSNPIDTTKLDMLNQLAFSASGGGFYSAWMALGGTAVTNEALETHDFGRFSEYYAQDVDPMDGLVSDWASRYGVNMMDYATKKQTFRTMATNGGTTADPVQGFNAFLLDMDPSLKVEQRLTVTGIVPEEDGTVTLTVRGPEGCNLRNAHTRAGRICVTRAETLDALSGADKELISTPDFNSDGSATLVLKSEKPMPFMKVTLEASIDVDQ